jgi:prolyl 4-hydroxylase
MKPSILVFGILFLFGGAVLLVGHLHNSSIRSHPVHQAARVAISPIDLPPTTKPKRPPPTLDVPLDVVDKAEVLEMNPKRVPWLPGTTNKTKGAVIARDGTRVGWSIISPQTPRSLRLYGTLSNEDCDSLVTYARKFLERSQVISRNFHGDSEVNQVRTSTGMFMASTEQRNFPANKKLHEHVMAIIGLPDETWIEATQILRYEAGQFYKPHTDYFDEADLPNMNRGGQRIISVLTWLTDVDEGGETIFPLARPNGPIQAVPGKGQSVLFYNVFENGKEDIASTHGGDPPRAGSIKYVAVLWIHGRTFN